MYWSKVIAALWGLNSAMGTDVDPGTELRILPLGDSITYGFQSTDGNGYRLRLQEDLSGSKLLFVGDPQRQGGNMANNQNAGYSGYTINEIAGASSHVISSDRPNIILLHAGTNDMNHDPPAASEPYDTAPERLGALIDQCIQGSPNAVILVAQIVHSGNAATDSRIQTFNKAIPGVVAQRADAGHHITVIDMSSITAEYLKDDLHPNDAGYQKMGDLWLASIQAVSAENWIQAPAGPDPIVQGQKAASCPNSPESSESRSSQRGKCPGNPVWYNPAPSGMIASGVGHGGDAKFVNDWLPQGQVATGIFLNGTGVRFADLNGDGRADYLWLNETNGAVILYLNTGSGNKMSWAPVNDGKPIASGVGPGAGVRFADISGDGRADYLFVEDSGAVQLYQNGGPDGKGGWLWIGPKQIATGVPGATQRDVFFADLDGNGRADYVVIGPKGELNMWLNMGSHSSYDLNWVPAGEIATGLGTPNISLVDITGDGRSDYMIWDRLGGLTGYLNVRGPNEGLPIWIDQGGSKAIAAGVGVDWRLCQLADFNNDGKADYAIIDVRDGAFDLYINNGKADTSVTGDGIWLVDMNNDGYDDYVFMDAEGRLTLYTNGGPNPDANLGWIWTEQGNGPIATGVGARREQIRLAYIYGTGRADYVVIDDISGAANVWANGGPANGGWLWTPKGQIATGLGAGAGVRFADIDGDGRDDYIFLDEKGAALVYINQVGINAANWVPLNDGKPVATGVGALREDVRFADIDGDGRADYIWTHPLDGSVDAWRNVAVNTGTSINWVAYPQKIATGVGYAGANVKFAFLANPRSGRADYVAIEPSTGALHVWLNDCSGLTATSSSSSTEGSCGAEPSASTVQSIGGPGNSLSPSTEPTAQPTNSPSAPSNGGSPTTPIVETSILGITVSGVITIGYPTIPPGAMPTGSSIGSLQPLASQVAQLYANAAAAIANIASATTPSSEDVSSAEQALANVYPALQLLLTGAQQISPQSVSGSDAQLLQNLQGQLPSILSQIGSAITQLGPSTHGTPDAAAIQQVASVLGSGGAIGQAIGSIIQPVASHPGPSNNGGGNNGGSGGGSGGNGGGAGGGGGDEITISGYTTIPSNTGLGSLPTSGPSAISALRPAASQLSSAIDDAARASSNSNPSLGDVSGLASLLSSLVGDASSLASGLEGIELSSFSAGEVPQIIEAQSGARNLLTLAVDLASDVGQSLSNPSSWINIFRRTHPRLVQGGSILAVAAPIIGFILNFHESPTLTSATASASAGASSSTAIPSQWLMNTVPGTTVSDFESFIKTLPDGGSGRRIAYDTADHQWYVGRMSLEQAQDVSKHPIIDQIVSNGPTRLYQASVRSSNHSGRHQKRVQPSEIIISEQPNGPKHLRALSLPTSVSIAEAQLGVEGDNPSVRYEFESIQGAGTFIYVIDLGFDTANYEFSSHPFETYLAQGVGTPANHDPEGHGTGMAAHAAGDYLGVASGATLVGVKWGDKLEDFEPEHFCDVWEWIVQDVRSKGRQGKAVIVWSYSTDHTLWIQQNGHVNYAAVSLPESKHMDIFLPLLLYAWRADIATVFPTGNTPDSTMGDRTPQRFATETNPLIIAGSMTDAGIPAMGNTPSGPARNGEDPVLVGHLDVYAIAVEIFVPIIGVWDQYLVKSGSSYAAAQVAGLAAYLMTAPSEERFRPGNVASAVKKRIVALARTANGPGKMLIYNGVREAFCRVGGRPAPKLKPRGALWQYPTVERSNLVARQDTSNSSKTTVYAGGFWAFDASQSSFSCSPPADPAGFSISQYHLKNEDPELAPRYYAFAANIIGNGGCASLKPGVQLEDEGWLSGPDEVSQITRGAVGSSFTLTPFNYPGITPELVCNTATSITFSRTGASSYSFKDNNGVSGTCYVDPAGHALSSYLCDVGQNTYNQVILLSCVGSADPNYCGSSS